MTPNLLARLALYGWPLVVLGFYSARRSKERLARTTAWMMILPVMFLPSVVVYKLPGIPEIDKHRLGFLAVALALQLFHRRELAPRKRTFDFPRWVLLILVIGGAITVYNNTDTVTIGVKVLPGLAMRDVTAIALSYFMDMYLPFVVGQRVFRTERDLRDLLGVLTLCALIYLPFCLLEVRLSPQFHRWIYGFHPAQFAQAARGGGFRPVVFMNHGLAVATFSFSCLCAALALRKVAASTRPVSIGWRALLSGGMVVLCKSLGSIMYSTVGAVLLLLRSNKVLSRVVLICAIMVVAYPVLRATKAIPTREVISLFQRINAERAASLEFRFDNEDALLSRAMQRPMFGWGTWGRNRIFDPESGQDLSVTDGWWIIMIGAFGYVGFLASYALMGVPLIQFVRRRRQLPRSLQTLTGALALMVSLFAFDLLPNSLSDYLPLAYAGALFTLTGRLQRAARRRGTTPEEQEPGPEIVIDNPVT